MNRDSSAKYIVDDGLSCGFLTLVTINQPWIVMNGQKYYLAIHKKAPEKNCAVENHECWELEQNYLNRFNAICKSYGFKSQAKSRDWPFIISKRPDKVAYLVKNKAGKYTPVIGRSEDAFMIMRSITCYDYVH